jgi:hypothetical protein
MRSGLSSDYEWLSGPSPVQCHDSGTEDEDHIVFVSVQNITNIPYLGNICTCC